jgi:RHS repeat-associated protein
MLWFSTPQVCGSGAQIAICEYFNSDATRCYVETHNLTCEGAPYDFGAYAFRAYVCGGPGPCGFPFPPPAAAKWTDRNDLPFLVTKKILGCPEPPTEDCESCTSCKQVGPGRALLGGGGARAGSLIGKAKLNYTAGGAGHLDFPGGLAWRGTLGRYWSHTYAQRIILDPLDPAAPPDSHVWLITDTATFREYGNLGAGGEYQTLRPSDDYRTLHRTAAGWELHDLEGTVTAFDNGGRWISTIDRNGNAITATYTGSDLTTVSFPDGRSELFGYGGGRLSSVTEVGVGGGDDRTWTLTWNGDDLMRLDEPDGTAWEMTYGDPAHPGYLTLLERIGTDGSRRVESGWQYDSHGNVTALWRGDASPAGAEAVDVWQLAFDDPADPVETTLTDPLGDEAVYSFGRDPKSERLRLSSISGDCPTCGLGPNSTFAYGDGAHPLLPTQIVDARGNATQLAYTPHGQVMSRTEAAGTAEERTTTFAYDAAFPALVTEVVQPSVEPGQLRHTLLGRDAGGNVTHREIRGWEAGQPFDCTAPGAPCYETVTAYNSAGQPETVDPPGFGTGDATTYSYDPSRGSLVADGRTDPLIGTTTFGHDPFNRRTSVTDANGVVSQTEYDDLDRVTKVAHIGATAAEGLVTEHVYTAFGDLRRTILPEGNVVEYGYDGAGRLTSIERRPDAATPGERTLYQLDAAGNRTREDLQRWDGAQWVTESTTSYLFTTRCHLDQVLHPDGTATEYAYDCNGNLERTWDANHPRFPEDPEPPPPPGDQDGALTVAASHVEAPPTATYAYDALDRLIAETQPWAGPEGGFATTTYAYDVQDHLASVTDAEGTTTGYVYSDRGLLTMEVSAVSGTTVHAYNEHGELESTTDARGVTMLRTVDELDRVTAVDYPDASLDTTYTWDDPTVDFSQGRLTAVARNGETVAYGYDRFGRTTVDGGLSYGFDKNGNVTTVGYPGDVTATYTHDFADRETSLTLQAGAEPPQPLVTAAGYLPSGPLASMSLGNGLAEARGFTSRYFPQTITVPGLTELSFTTDAVGNLTGFQRTVGTNTYLGSYGYLDVEYFLTSAAGRWGNLAWSHDTIGNRLSETAGGGDGDAGSTESLYAYVTNATGGNTARLDQVQLADGSAQLFGYDAAGKQDQLDVLQAEGGTSPRDLGYDAASRLAAVDAAGQLTTFRYDGRGFLAEAAGPGGTARTLATYASDGRLMHRRHERAAQEPPPDADEPPPGSAATSEDAWILHFAGRPLALYFEDELGATRLVYLTTDHLGAPMLATDPAGAAVWQGGIAPFGDPYTLLADAGSPGDGDGGGGSDGDDPDDPPLPPPPPPGGEDCTTDCDDGRSTTPFTSVFAASLTTPAAQPEGIFLRYPGQWSDPLFDGTGLPTGMSYNVHRWYASETGRYSRPDPMNEQVDPNRYYYAGSNPLFYTDPLGLLCQLTPQWRDCLSKILGFPVQQIKVHDNSSLPDLITKGATFTLPGKIFLPGTCGEFYGNPWLVLHEYYHVVDQWDTGRMSLGGYLAEGAGQWLEGRDPHGDNKYENEADFFADTHLNNLEDCIGCAAAPGPAPPPPPPSPCVPGLGSRTRGMIPAQCR